MGMTMFAQKARKPRQDDAEFDMPLRRGDQARAKAMAFAGGAPDAARLGGATFGESVGDVTRPVGFFLGSVFGSSFALR
jgi:hypothetical protein